MIIFYRGAKKYFLLISLGYDQICSLVFLNAAKE